VDVDDCGFVVGREVQATVLLVTPDVVIVRDAGLQMLLLLQLLLLMTVMTVMTPSHLHIPLY